MFDNTNNACLRNVKVDDGSLLLEHKIETAVVSMSNLLTMTNLSKAYSGVKALDNVSMSISRGEVHALCGENGAGKSTLIKCLTGVVRPEVGTILFDGDDLAQGSVHEAESAGVAVIHQESTAFTDLNAVDNIFVGREQKTKWGLLDYDRMRKESRHWLTMLGQELDLGVPLRDLSPASRQMVSIARALSRKCKLLVMDEPTASLSEKETAVLLDTVRQLSKQGVAVLYVSHRLPEIFAIADCVTVLRDGKLIDTASIEEVTKSKLIQKMVGREVDLHRRSRRTSVDPASAVRLETRQLSGNGFDNISLSIRSGEIVGLGGLIGAGRSELARAIVGLDQSTSGEIYLDGDPFLRRDYAESIRHGLVMVPEDRQHEGLVLPMPVDQNLTMSVLHQLTCRKLVNRYDERALVRELVERFSVKVAAVGDPVSSLSGGNQQKVVLGKWLATEPRVLILDEPTRGVDVGAKAQVHELIEDLATLGLATLVISSEIQELLAVCTRIIVMREGRLAGELSTPDASQDKILELALRGDPNATASKKGGSNV